MRNAIGLSIIIIMIAAIFGKGIVSAESRVSIASCEKYYLSDSITTTTIKNSSGAFYGIVASGTAAGYVTLADSTTTFATVYVEANKTISVILIAPTWFSTNFEVTNSTTALNTTVLYK